MLALKVKKCIPDDIMIFHKVAFILFVMTPGAQTIGNIAAYGSAKRLVEKFMDSDGISITVQKFCHESCFFLV